MLREGFSRTAEAARRANVAVYAINPLGGDGFDSERDRRGYEEQASFARESGGRGFGPWTDYRASSGSSSDDNNTFYVMSYYRDPANVPGTANHRSKCVLLTKPDLSSARTREGTSRRRRLDPDGSDAHRPRSPSRCR